MGGFDERIEEEEEEEEKAENEGGARADKVASDGREDPGGKQARRLKGLSGRAFFVVVEISPKKTRAVTNPVQEQHSSNGRCRLSRVQTSLLPPLVPQSMKCTFLWQSLLHVLLQRESTWPRALLRIPAHETARILYIHSTYPKMSPRSSVCAIRVQTVNTLLLSPSDPQIPVGAETLCCLAPWVRVNISCKPRNRGPSRPLFASITHRTRHRAL